MTRREELELESAHARMVAVLLCELADVRADDHRAALSARDRADASLAEAARHHGAVRERAEAAFVREVEARRALEAYLSDKDEL